MLIIEFSPNIKYGSNLLKYRNIDDNKWYTLHINIETLGLLVDNFGIISNDYQKKAVIKYCGAQLELQCGNNSDFWLPLIEQNIHKRYA